MLILFGSRAYIRGLAIVTFICSNCHNPAAQRVLQRVTKFTLFFIPLFPIRSSYSTTCTFCGLGTKIDKAQADQYVDYARQQAAQGRPAGPPQEQIPSQPGQLGQPQQYGQPTNGQQQYGQNLPPQ